MNDKYRLFFAKNAMEIKESLDEAVAKAGGDKFSADQLGEMTALDFLTVLSTNKIRFVYEEVVEPDKIEGDLKLGDQVLVYDRYRFAIPLKAILIRASNETEKSETSHGVLVRLQETNNSEYPVGETIWVHRKQIEVISK